MYKSAFSSDPVVAVPLKNTAVAGDSTFTMNVSIAAATAAVAAAAGPESQMLGTVSSVVGLAAAPLFIASAIIGLVRQFPSSHEVTVRMWAGQGDEGIPLGGNLPSVGLWNVNGKWLGSDRKHNHHIREGNWRQFHVKTPGTNEKPDYIAVAADERDAICLSGIQLTWSDIQTDHLFLGDIPAACGLPWYHSKLSIADSPHRPKCVWIDGSGKSKKRPDKDTHPGTIGSIQDPPAGFSFHIADFVGAVVTKEVAAQRSESLDYTCGHPARFKVWDAMGGHLKIPIFQTLPPRGADFTDSIDAGQFRALPWKWSEPLHRHIAHGPGPKRDLEAETSMEIEGADNFHVGYLNATQTEEEVAAAERRHALPHGLLNKGHASAFALCNSPTSWGPDFYSLTENRYCHMATKTMYPACASMEQTECFDAGINEIRETRCARGQLCRRAEVESIWKQYTRVDEWKE